jgi:hypothetical protein
MNDVFLNRKEILGGERSCEKHAPRFMNISGDFIISIPKYTAFIGIKESN